MVKLIGITGVKGSGKDTAFSFIKSDFPTSIQLSLAGKLKTVCSEVFDIPSNFFHDQNLKEKEFEDLIVLEEETMLACIKKYKSITDYSYDSHIRPLLGHVIYTPRQLLQTIGTDLLRNINDEVHCNEVNLLIKDPGIYVLTDVRFINEFEYFKNRQANNFIPLYVKREAAELNTDGHASEQEILSIGKMSTMIPNNGTLAEFRARVLEHTILALTS